MKIFEDRTTDGRFSGNDSRVMLRLVGLSILAIAVCYVAGDLDIGYLARSVLFDVVMAFVALGVAGLFGLIGGLVQTNHEDQHCESFCFVGAVVGATLFFFCVLA